MDLLRLSRLALHGLPLALLGLCQCSYSAANTAQLYMGRGQTALAWEYWRTAVTESPANDSVRAGALVAHALQSHELSQEIGELTDAKRPLRALGLVITLEEAAAVGQKLNLSGDAPAVFMSQRHTLAQSAMDSMQQDLDARLARGLPQVRDLTACDTLHGLATDDADVARMCERLLGTFRHVAVLRGAPGSHPATAAVLARAAESIVTEHARLLGVAALPDTQNALLEVYVGTPETRGTDWVQDKRDAYHTAVARLDDKGRTITETHVVEPTAQEVAAAAKNKQPAPAPRREVKTVYDQVAGEYRFFRMDRQIAVPFRATLTDLRSNTVVAAVADVLHLNTESRYHTYSGDPRARHHPEPAGATQRESAPALRSEQQLVEDAMRTIPSTMSKALVAEVDS